MSQDNLLTARFYSAFDSALVSQFVARLAELTEDGRRGHPGFLGEGTHFQSFEFSSRDLRLAVNIAKQSFIKRGDLALARWQQAIGIARSIADSNLIPPMELLTVHGVIAVVMPKGEVMVKGRGRAIEAMLHETAKALSRAGLVLDDYPQIREVLGVPFIIDWSDLSFAI